MAPLKGRSKNRAFECEALCEPGASARVDLHRPLANVKVGIQIGLKAVLEHRAPKASTPILHTRGAESKVGRVPHLQDHQQLLFATHPAHATRHKTVTPIVTVKECPNPHLRDRHAHAHQSDQNPEPVPPAACTCVKTIQ